MDPAAKSVKADWLLVALLACAIASLAHHVHNAAFLDHYPSMPAWLSAPMVYAAWVLATAIGFIGYFTRRAGLLALYALYCLEVLAHYALAPMSAHTLATNISIWLEAVAAAALLVALALSPPKSACRRKRDSARLRKPYCRRSCRIGSP